MPRHKFLGTLPPAFQKDNFLPIDLTIHKLEDCVMQLLVALRLENEDIRVWEPYFQLRSNRLHFRLKNTEIIKMM